MAYSVHYHTGKEKKRKQGRGFIVLGYLVLLLAFALRLLVPESVHILRSIVLQDDAVITFVELLSNNADTSEAAAVFSQDFLFLQP